MKFRVISLNAAGNDLVNVAFAQVTDDTTTVTPGFNGVAGTGNLNLVLSNEDAKAYWPNGVYTLTLKADATA
jgi:hypothetical protein